LKRDLIKSNSFIKTAKKYVLSNPNVITKIKNTLLILEEDCFSPLIRTHKLKGNLEGYYACSAGYDLRIVFQIIKIIDKEYIFLESIGSHADVY
jgi:addiction module RelE/StbE family toxin